MRFINFVLIFTTIILACFAGVGAQASGVRFDFDQTDIKSFIKVVSEITGKNFVLDEKITGKITVISPREIAVEEVFPVFESIMNVYGYAVVQSGGVYKILPLRSVKTEGLPTSVRKGLTVPSTDNFITQIIPLEHAAAKDVLSVLQPMVSREGTIVTHAPSNTLIVTDTTANIKRLLAIVKELDSDKAVRQIYLYPLKHADASTLAGKLKTILKDTTGPADAKFRLPQSSREPEIVPDERTNTLIVLMEPYLKDTIDDLLTHLDQETPLDKRSIHVYYLEHADAKELAEVLKQLIGKETRRPEDQTILSSSVKVAPDVSTNSLIITASPTEYDAIEQVIEQLDLPRAQVLIETIIAEISVDATREMGVEWRLVDEISPDGYTGVGGSVLPSGTTGSALAQTAINPYNPPSGLVLGLVKGTITYNGQEFLNMAALARAFETDSSVNLLSTPYILTTDHHEALIIVGEERPFLQSSQVTANDSVIRSYEYKDVGLTLRLTPHITQTGLIRLAIFQEIKDFVEQSEVGAITTTKRQADTTVIVKNGQTCILGGLMKSNQINNKWMVPCLGKIPGLGWLFKTGRAKKLKTNLLIFMTPHIIEKQEDLIPITEEKQSELSGFSEKKTILDWRLGTTYEPTPTPIP